MYNSNDHSVLGTRFYIVKRHGGENCGNKSEENGDKLWGRMLCNKPGLLVEHGGCGTLVAVVR